MNIFQRKLRSKHLKDIRPAPLSTRPGLDGAKDDIIGVMQDYSNGFGPGLSSGIGGAHVLDDDHALSNGALNNARNLTTTDFSQPQYSSAMDSQIAQYDPCEDLLTSVAELREFLATPENLAEEVVDEITEASIDPETRNSLVSAVPNEFTKDKQFDDLALKIGNAIIDVYDDHREGANELGQIIGGFEDKKDALQVYKDGYKEAMESEASLEPLLEQYKCELPS